VVVGGPQVKGRDNLAAAVTVHAVDAVGPRQPARPDVVVEGPAQKIPLPAGKLVPLAISSGTAFYAYHEPMSDLTDAEYNLLLTFRSALRAFMVWSEQEAVKAGLTAQQHQLLLVVRAHNEAASVSDIAAALQIRHHSAVGLVRRAESLHLLERRRDSHDARVVRLRLTPEASVVLERLSRAHLAELQRAAAMLHISEDFLQHLSADFIERVPEHYT